MATAFRNPQPRPPSHRSWAGRICLWCRVPMVGGVCHNPACEKGASNGPKIPRRSPRRSRSTPRPIPIPRPIPLPQAVTGSQGAWGENRVAKAVAKAMTIWILWHWPFLIEPWWTQRQLAPCDHHWVILEVMPPTDTLTVEALQDAIDALNQYTHPSWEPIFDLRLWPRPRSTKVTNRYCSKCGEKSNGTTELT